MQEVPAERETKVLKTSHPRLNIRKVERGVGKPTNKRKLKQGQPKEIFDPCATRGEHHRPVPLRLLNVHDADDADAQSNFRGPRGQRSLPQCSFSLSDAVLQKSPKKNRICSMHSLYQENLKKGEIIRPETSRQICIPSLLTYVQRIISFVFFEDIKQHHFLGEIDEER